MVILFAIFVVQFFVAIACVAVNNEQVFSSGYILYSHQGIFCTQFRIYSVFTLGYIHYSDQGIFSFVDMKYFQIEKLIIKGWSESSNATKFDAEQHFQCCGLRDVTTGVTCTMVGSTALQLL